MRIVVAVLILCAAATAGSVAGRVSLVPSGGGKPANAAASANAVVWLKPAAAGSREFRSSARTTFKIIQKRRKFEPRVLAIPVGAAVDFPNLDPFFHNVFSLYDGKRFDLGLYEAGSTHQVHFDRPGVSYIFCNIHPEMSAVVVAVDSPYFAMTNRAGEYSIPNVPPGRYLLYVFHERGKPDSKDEFPRPVDVTSGESEVRLIRLIDSGQLTPPHRNKYGRDYDPPPTNAIYK